MPADVTGGDATDAESIARDFTDSDSTDAAAFWEHRYTDTGQVWSGRANAVLVDVATDLPVGQALDLGCGEGGDAIWLARAGWRVTAVDISPTALARGASGAMDIPEGRIDWVAADLDAWTERGPHGPFDLVTASFLHSPVEIARTAILRRAAGFVAEDGCLLIVSHTAFPPWSDHRHDDHRFLDPREEIAELALPEREWEVRIAETRRREATGPDGQHGWLDDGVVLLRRRAAHGDP
jgi:SAM-dependent methyltransferase